jgi:hypothetical protein
LIRQSRDPLRPFWRLFFGPTAPAATNLARRRWSVARAFPKEKDMPESKSWWQSRTMWVNIVAMLFAALGAFKMLPAGIDQDAAVTAIMGGVAIANVVLRLVTKRAIA